MLNVASYIYGIFIIFSVLTTFLMDVFCKEAKKKKKTIPDISTKMQEIRELLTGRSLTN